VQHRRPPPPVGDAGSLQIRSRDLGVLGLVFQCHHPTLRPDSAGQPNGAEPTQGADLEDASGRNRAGQQREELALLRRHRDLRKPGASLDSSAADSAGSSPIRVLFKNASTSSGSLSGHGINASNSRRPTTRRDLYQVPV